MKQIWAPWRAEYIQAGKGEGCVLCNAAAVKPGTELVLWNGSASVVLLNKFPYNSGHLMVAPARHVSKVEELTPEESGDIFRLIRHSVSVLKDLMNPDGFNIGMNVGRAAGAGIDDHLHIHIVPRWNGDANFMPVLADIKIIPEHLDETMKKLLPRFKDIGQ